MLSEDQKSFYQTNGYILIENLLSKDEAAFYRQECHELSQRLSLINDADRTWESARTSVKGAVASQILYCHSVQLQSAAFMSLLIDPRFTDVASELMDLKTLALES